VALVQMNGFPLAGRPLKVGRSERSASFPDVGEADKIGALMAASSSTGSDPLAAATAAASIIGSLPQLQDPLLGQSAVSVGRRVTYLVLNTKHEQ